MEAYESVLRRIVGASDRCKKFAEYLSEKIPKEHAFEKGSLLAVILSTDISSTEELNEALNRKISYFFSMKFLEHT